MIRRLLVVLVVAGGLGLLATVAGQEPPPPAPPQSPAPPQRGFDADAVVQEVQAFYAEYRRAWDERDTLAIANCLAGDFTAYQYVEPQGLVRLDKPGAVSGVGQFFEAVRGRETLWSRSVLAVVPRSATEAVVAVRNDFSLREGGGEAELTVEVLRKGRDARWRIVRKWTEKSPF